MADVITETKSDQPVEGWPLLWLGLWVVAQAIAIIVTMWLWIPACDVGGIAVAGIEPRQVVTGSGEGLRILGSGFTREARVQIGGTPAATTVVNGFELVVKTPALPIGFAPVIVTQPGLPDTPAPTALEVVPAGPRVTRVSPSQLLTKGNETLRIFGDRFAGGALVTIGTGKRCRRCSSGPRSSS
jgi:hypothetical protein